MASTFSLQNLKIMEFDLENPLTSFKEHQSDTVLALFENESDHAPSVSFEVSDFRYSVRRDAISLISQARNFDSFIAYLAINYLDRFISKQEMQQAKPWMVRLLAISCISLAAKMKNADFSLSKLQRDVSFIFDAQSTNRMEAIILSTLNWRMRSITPFSFLYFFLSLFELKDPSLTQSLKNRASEIIFRSQYEIKFLEYKPSIMAASALLSASHEFCPLQFPCFRDVISSSKYVNKERLLMCWSLMQEMAMDGYESAFDAVSSCTYTPISVLDRHCANSESKKTTNHSMLPERDNNKRRKLNDFRDDHMLQFSQIQQC